MTTRAFRKSGAEVGRDHGDDSSTDAEYVEKASYLSKQHQFCNLSGFMRVAPGESFPTSSRISLWSFCFEWPLWFKLDIRLV